MVWNGDNRCKWSLDAGSLIIYLFRGEREKGWLGVRQWYLVPGQNWSWSDPLLFPKTRTFLASIHFCQCILSSLLRDSFIFTTFKCYFYYSYKEWYGFLLFVSRPPKSVNRRGERSEKYRRIDIRGNKKHKFNSERWFQLLSLFFSFFSSSTLRVEKEGRVQISSVTTKRRNFVLRVNTDEPAALTSAPLSHFTLFIRLSATLSRPRPFMRAHGHISNLPIYCSLLTFRCACISRILVHG